jgi:hypothetical protein
VAVTRATYDLTRWCSNGEIAWKPTGAVPPARWCPCARTSDPRGGDGRAHDSAVELLIYEKSCGQAAVDPEHTESVASPAACGLAAGESPARPHHYNRRSRFACARCLRQHPLRERHPHAGGAGAKDGRSEGPMGRLRLGPDSTGRPRLTAIAAPRSGTCFFERDPGITGERRPTAEGVGTCLLVLAAAGAGSAVAPLAASSPALPLIAIAAAIAGALVELIIAFGEISGGHFNPLISRLQWLAGERPLHCTLSYIAAQCVDGIAGPCSRRPGCWPMSLRRSPGLLSLWFAFRSLIPEVLFRNTLACASVCCRIRRILPAII